MGYTIIVCFYQKDVQRPAINLSPFTHPLHIPDRSDFNYKYRLAVQQHNQESTSKDRSKTAKEELLGIKIKSPDLDNSKGDKLNLEMHDRLIQRPLESSILKRLEPVVKSNSFKTKVLAKSKINSFILALKNMTSKNKFSQTHRIPVGIVSNTCGQNHTC